MNSLNNTLFSLEPGILNFFILGLGAFIIKILFNIILSIYNNYKCKKVSKNLLIDEHIIQSKIKNNLLSEQFDKYIDTNNNFYFELSYFLGTTLIAVTGILFNDITLLTLFFSIKTSRHIILYSKISYLTFGNKYLVNIDESKVYSIIFYTEILSLEDIYSEHDLKLESEIEVLCLKFKELARNNKIDYNIYNELISQQTLNQKVKDIIDSNYYKMILEN